MPSFGTLLTEYMKRTGISDSELARSIGVQRQTIFRWKEGTVARPRVREDVLHCATRLRLTSEERDLLLIAAGFPPENPTYVVPPTTAEPANPPPLNPAFERSDEQSDEQSDQQFDEQEAQADQESVPIEGGLPPFVTSLSPHNLSPNDLSSDKIASQMPRIEMASHLPTAEPIPWSHTASLQKPDGEVKLGHASRQSKGSQTYIWWVFASLLVLIGGTALWRPLSTLWQIAPTPIATAQIVHLNRITPQLPSPTPTLTPSPTPAALLSISAAKEGEILIICAEFNYLDKQNYRMTTLIADALEEEIGSAELDTSVRVQTWPHVIPEAAEAERIVNATKASLLIWGEYDAARVVIRYGVPASSKPSSNQLLLPSPDKLHLMLTNDAPKEAKAIALVALGQIYRKSKPAEAEKVLLRALNQKSAKPELNIRALSYLGLIEISKGCNENRQQIEICDQAIQYLTDAIALDPTLRKDWWILWYNLGVTYINRSLQFSQSSPEFQQNVQAAIDNLNLAVQYQPEDWRLYYNRGVAYYWRNQEGDTERVIQEVSIVLASQPAHLNSYKLRGLASLRLSKDRQWEADFQKMLTLPTTASEKRLAYSLLCWGYAVNQEVQAAHQACDQMKALAPKEDQDLADSQDLLGILLAQEDQLAEAIAAFERYLIWVKNESGVPYERKNGPLVEQWIADLKAGKNPFDAAMLERLRTQ